MESPDETDPGDAGLHHPGQHLQGADGTLPGSERWFGAPDRGGGCQRAVRLQRHQGDLGKPGKDRKHACRRQVDQRTKRG